MEASELALEITNDSDTINITALNNGRVVTNPMLSTGGVRDVLNVTGRSPDAGKR